eukprot:GILJ01008273.1.p1 GENE.GILJ01008273.1~~GILJ01008273.1.p1  ORF type:complete len:272 (+),score=35.40 GILJ01008273.1:451-1266(+)
MDSEGKTLLDTYSSHSRKRARYDDIVEHVIDAAQRAQRIHDDALRSNGQISAALNQQLASLRSMYIKYYFKQAQEMTSHWEASLDNASAEKNNVKKLHDVFQRHKDYLKTTLTGTIDPSVLEVLDEPEDNNDEIVKAEFKWINEEFRKLGQFFIISSGSTHLTNDPFQRDIALIFTSTFADMLGSVLNFGYIAKHQVVTSEPGWLYDILSNTRSTLVGLKDQTTQWGRDDQTEMNTWSSDSKANLANWMRKIDFNRAYSDQSLVNENEMND